ncbi:MAG: ornithine cyclodeaminase family protein [Polyangiales bacterium]
MTGHDIETMTTLVLTRKEVEAVATVALAVDAVEDAFAAFGRGDATMPPKIYLGMDDSQGDFRAMPARLGDAAGIKWVNVHPRNRTQNALPTVMGTYVLNDPATGFPLAVMDGTFLTALRTGAAGAVASRFLAGAAPSTVAFIGAGVQARMLHDAHRIVFPDFSALIHDRDPKAAATLAAETGGRVVDLEHAAGADIVCTATPSTEPIVVSDWVRPGAHINAMGADAPGKQELDVALLEISAVYVDDLHQATRSGEINVPVTQGAFRIEELAGTLGAVVAGIDPAPKRGATTVFDSTGLAIQDVALAHRIYQAAVRKGAGSSIDLLGLREPEFAKN